MHEPLARSHVCMHMALRDRCQHVLQSSIKVRGSATSTVGQTPATPLAPFVRVQPPCVRVSRVPRHPACVSRYPALEHEMALTLVSLQGAFYSR